MFIVLQMAVRIWNLCLFVWFFFFQFQMFEIGQFDMFETWDYIGIIVSVWNKIIVNAY